MTHPSSQHLSDYLDGELAAAETSSVEQHLRACTDCAALMDDLRGIRRQATRLEQQDPARDLWPDIRTAIQNGAGREAGGIGRPPTRRSPSVRHGTLRLTYPQAAAAALLLCVLSGALSAFVAHARAVASVQAGVPVASWVERVMEVHPELAGSAEEITRLERILAEQSPTLDPATSRLLNTNLEVVDRAIDESLHALTADPDNFYLRNHLARAVEVKADYLRSSADLFMPGS